MARNYLFYGRVHPERANFSFNAPIKIKGWADVSINIYANQITIFCRDYEGDLDLETLRNILQSHSQALMDLYGLSNRYRYRVEILGYQDLESDVGQVWGIHVECLNEEEKKLFEEEMVIDEFLPLLSDPVLRMMLSDFRSAMEYPDDTAVFSHRIAESIYHCFKNGNKTVRLKAMGEALRVDAVKMKNELGRIANDKRHGKLTSITWEERKRSMRASCWLISRYASYKRLGNLDPDVYPLIQY